MSLILLLTAHRLIFVVDFREYSKAADRAKFTEFEFLHVFRLMLSIEDLDAMKAMEDNSLSHQKVAHYQNCRLTLRQIIDHNLSYQMCAKKMALFVNSTYVIESSKKLPYDVMDFDYITLTDMEDFQNYSEDLHEIAEDRVTCKIHYVFDRIILFQVTFQKMRESRKKNQLVIDEDRPFHVEFQPNRVSIRVAQRGVEDAITFNLTEYLCDFKGKASQKLPKSNICKFQWMNQKVNAEQRAAIKNIVNCSSFPSPYIIFGPPGTGKTSTVIEAIAQIVKLKPLAHILVTAKSNASCDDIGNRLLPYVSVNKVLRLYSPAFDKKPDKIDKNLQQISNFRSRYTCSCKKRSCPEAMPCDDPSYEEFYTARVVIATLTSCGRLVSAKVKTDHFDYIFIDEAASESEPSTLVPITGLGASIRGVSAQIVLSGDHYQLSAIINNRFSRQLGMEKSMMERIMQTNKKYQRSPTYNRQFVTQLVKNYRSHPALLHFSNENFYDSQLVAKCNPSIANFAIGWEGLMRNKDFPLLFHTTKTHSKEVGVSLMNEGEVNLVKMYVDLLLIDGINGKRVLQTDIGIISPYCAQRDRMREQFEAEYPKLEIGTVDSYQGREKKIIILSTVRSGTKHVGFLRNVKRLNVAITRAQCLLIIVGNATTLQKCQIWNKFIGFCVDNHAVVGDLLSLDVVAATDENYEGGEDRPENLEDEYDGCE